MQKGKFLCPVTQNHIIDIDLNGAIVVHQAMKTWTPADDEAMPVSHDLTRPCYFAVFFQIALIQFSDTVVYLFPDSQAEKQ